MNKIIIYRILPNGQTVQLVLVKADVLDIVSKEEVSKILLFIFISPIHAFCVIVPSFKCVDAAFAIYSVRNGIQRQTAFLSGLLVDQCDCVHSFFMKKIRIQPFNAKHEYDY